MLNINYMFISIYIIYYDLFNFLIKFISNQLIEGQKPIKNAIFVMSYII